MKKILPVLIVSILLSSSANAEKEKHKNSVNIDQVVTSLQLEAKIATNLKSLIESHREKRQALREQNIKDRAQRKTLRKEHRQAIRELLGDEKMNEFEELMHKNHPKHGKHQKQKQDKK